MKYIELVNICHERKMKLEHPCHRCKYKDLCRIFRDEFCPFETPNFYWRFVSKINEDIVHNNKADCE